MSNGIDTAADPATQLLELIESGNWLPPHLFPPPGAQSKNLFGFVPIAAPGSAYTDIFTPYVVPAGMVLVINQLGNVVIGAGFIEGTGQVVWQIWDNGNPIEDYEAIPGSLGGTSDPSKIAPLVFQEGHTVEFVYQNAAGSGIPADSVQVGATLRGWLLNRLQTGVVEWPI